MSVRQGARGRAKAFGGFWLAAGLFLWGAGAPVGPVSTSGEAAAAIPPDARQEQLVRFLAATLPPHPSSPRRGVVGEIVLEFIQRTDRGGMIVTFEPGAGSFSQRTQAAIILAIDRAARLAGLETYSWSVILSLRRPEAVVHGDSLSAMVALSTVAVAKHDMVQPGRVVTGTVTDQGVLGTVSALPYKVEAAHREHLERVILPDREDVVDPPWRTPFLMQVSPVASVEKAYEALTGVPMVDRERRAPHR